MVPEAAKTWVIYHFPSKACNSKHFGETGITTLKTRIAQHKAAVHNCHMSHFTTLHCLATGYQFAFDEVRIIARAQSKAGRLFIETIHSNENSTKGYITLDQCYTLIKGRLTLWTLYMCYIFLVLKIHICWWSDQAYWPTCTLSVIHHVRLFFWLAGLDMALRFDLVTRYFLLVGSFIPPDCTFTTALFGTVITFTEQRPIKSTWQLLSSFVPLFTSWGILAHSPHFSSYALSAESIYLLYNQKP